MTRKLALRDFLRARRSAVQPAAAGLPEGGQRRVAGLRREEVAMLAGVSVDYYTRLEQGRDISPSDSVLDSIARVLRLTPAQRSQLYALVRDGAGRETSLAEEPVRPTVLKLLVAVDIPAIVVGRGTRVIASNPLHRALTTDFSKQPFEQRFYAHWLFLDPTAQTILLDWARSARETVGVLRSSVTRFPHDRRLRALVDELSESSKEFLALWKENDVEDPSSGAKRYRHPVAGELTLLHEVAQLSGEHWIHMYWAEPGSPSAGALDLLRAAVRASP
ncbi:helix-turn-helix transcriptional regulator [Micromonospora sp. NPDC093244]|uniref:helix-turn-helix transcriptional regulator n=1 Tax=Micromonospora sp. NPDC093244 TaxID=3155071 RepID=UPI00341DCE93